MLLKKVNLKNFKKFKELEREFGPGINVVKGHLNEMGKSTLLNAIVAALFENPKSTKKELEDYTTWGSNRKCTTAIEFDVQGKKYILEKDFEKKSIRLAEIDTGKEWYTIREATEKLRELLGTDSPTLFLSTSCIRQNQVTDIESGRKEIGDSLEEIVTGGTEETMASQVIKKLSNRISALTKGTETLAKSPGPLASLDHEKKLLERELNEVREGVKKTEKQRIDLIEITEKLDKVISDLSNAETLREKNKRLKEIEIKIAGIEIDYERTDKLIQDIELSQKQIENTEAELMAIKGFGNMEKVKEIRSRFPGLEANRQIIDAQLPERMKELEAAETNFKRNRLLIALTTKPALIVGAVVSVVGFLGVLFNTASLAAGIIGLLFLVGALWERSSLTQYKTQISDLRNRSDQMKKALTEIEKEERDILSQINCSSVEEFRQKDGKYADLVELRDKSQHQLEGKLGTQKLEQIEHNRRQIAKTLAVEEAKFTDDLKSTKLSPEEYVKLEKKIKDLGEEKERLERSKMECTVGINTAKFNPEDQALMEERLASLTNALRQEQKKLRIFQITKDFVERARTETLVSAKDILQTQTQKNFEIFTDGKYRKVAVIVGEKIDFSIYSGEKGDWVRPEELSGGVNDELYLACRLALVRLIYGETKPPLLLDDPFSNFDQPRLARTLEFFKQMSNEYQIIIFTLSNAYDNIADRMIELK